MTTKKPTSSSSTPPKKKAPAAPKAKKASTAKPGKGKKKTEDIEDTGLPQPSYHPPAPTYIAPAAVTPPPAPAPAPVKPQPAPVAKPAPAPVKPAQPAPATKSAQPASPVKPAPARPTPTFYAKPSPAPVRSQPAPAPRKETAPRPPAPTPAPVASSVAEKEKDGKTKIVFNEMMTVKDLADAMSVKVPDVIKKLLTVGTPASINQRLQYDTAALVADAFGFHLELKSIYVDEVKEEPENKALLKARPPVVTVMGHVDHGKTSLLDAIRKADVAAGEAGGITQHIGAYQVKLDKGAITFLDTPGHEAFTAMRARGAMATDLVVLVVAAEDSVMPQTVEAINHAKAAGVPIVVAINKVDLPQANVQKVKQELAQYELVAEDWGGKTIMVEVSAKTRLNVDKLLEMILLEAEILELKANPDRAAKGVVLEAHMDPRRGVVSTILVQAGTLKVGDIVVCGLASGRVRALFDEYWKPVNSAGPSAPARVLGLAQAPQAGDQLTVVNSEREAREIAERRQQFMKDAGEKKGSHVSLESLHSKIAEGKIQELPIIIKCDVQGSLQAIQDSLGKLSGSNIIKLKYIHSGLGNINESDVLLAEASDAIVFGFHVKVEAKAEAEAKRTGVDLRQYQIIYEMLSDIKAAMEGLLKPIEKEVVKGRAQVKEVYPASKVGQVAGCMILEGKIIRGQKCRVLRGGQEVGMGSISSLRRFKDDVKEVEKGFECGLSVDGIKNFVRGDIVEVFVIEKQARRLDA